jgi:phospholipase/carboxylesterase
MLHTHFIPAAQAGSRRLMVMLHGLGDSVNGYLWLPEMLALPWMNFALINAPDPYYGGFSWYEFDGHPAETIRRSTAMLFRRLDGLRAEGFPTEQTIFGGFSQGCLMSVEVGGRYPHRFAGVVGISGYVWEPETLVKELSPVAREQRFLITHGTVDPLLPIARTRPQVKTLQAAGLNIQWEEFAKEHTIAGHAELDVIREFIRAGYPETAG